MNTSIGNKMLELSAAETMSVAGGMGIQADQVCRFTAEGGFVCEPAPQEPRPFPGGFPVVN